jgi:hypothetical protein
MKEIPISQIMKWRDKKKAAFFLQAIHGLDFDYIPGRDDGEPPKYATYTPHSK